MTREYLALAAGDIARGGTVDAPIGRHPTRRTTMAVVADGQAGAHALRGARALRRRDAARAAGSRPAAPTRSACTSPRSATRSSAIRRTAGRARSVLRGRRCTRRGSRSSHPVTGRPARGNRRCRRTSRELLAGCARSAAVNDVTQRPDARRPRSGRGPRLDRARLAGAGPRRRAGDDARTAASAPGPAPTMNLGRNGDDESGARRKSAPLRRVPARRRPRGSTRCTAPRSRPADAHGGPPAPVADAAVTRERGVVCAMLTADCLPVLFADRAGTAVGIAHAGWRGLAAGVLEATVAALRDLGAQPARRRRLARSGDRTRRLRGRRRRPRRVLRATIPARAACFAPHARRQVARRSLWPRPAAARARGVTRVDGGDFCTYTDAARFFSYRRDAPDGPDGGGGLARRLTPTSSRTRAVAGEIGSARRAQAATPIGVGASRCV